MLKDKTLASKKLKVGIAGYGVVGKRRRFYIDQHPLLEMVAVSDQTFDGAGELADGIRYFDKIEELLKCNLDVLFVCLPNYLAPASTIKGLERGLHVFCEKPPGRNIEDVESVIRAERAYPKMKLKYGFNHRYHHSVKDARQIVESKQLGKIINVNGVYGKSHVIPYDKGWRAERQKSGGGILLDQGIHMVDLMRLFCGDFTEFTSFVANDYWRHDVEDNVYALMRNNDGQVAMLHSTATSWQHRFRLEIALTEGYLVLKGFLSGSRSYGEETLTIGRRFETDTGTPREETIKYLDDSSWNEEIGEFVDSIVHGKPILEGSSSEALKTMAHVYRIYCADADWKKRFDLADQISADMKL